MKIRLVARKIQPKGVPVTLEIKAKEFSGDSVSDVLHQMKHYFADEVIPRIPFLRLDEPYRRQVREMSNVDLCRMLVQYTNDQNGAQCELPDTDESALTTLEGLGFLVAEPE